MFRSDNTSLSPFSLTEVSALQWLRWLEALSSADPELARALRFLEAIVQQTQTEGLKKSVQAYIGANKCPSAAGCQRLHFRTTLISALTTDSALQESLRIWLSVYALEKLLPACDGAEDRTGALRTSVRDLVQKVLQFLHTVDWPVEQRVELIFSLSLVDQCTLVEPVWWWNALLRLDREHAILLASHEVESLSVVEPGHGRTWKTLGGRWMRLRLKSFLEHAGENKVLAALLSKSALDDFEAAQAVSLLQLVGRGREALQLAERWHRMVPASPVLAEVLVELYLRDGWEKEALELLKDQYRRDPLEKWVTLLKKAAGKDWDIVAKTLNIPS
ncbi:MAG: hypothetical protein LW629_00825 [Burkholderiales bacterium]|nr:hypothetical protein [Burkholderiales bacterium]